MLPAAFMQLFVPWQDQQDQHDLLIKTGYGSVYAEQDLKFAETSIIVAVATDESVEAILQKVKKQVEDGAL